MKEDVSNQRRIKVVRDHAGVDLLLTLRSVRCLGPFLRGERSLGEAADELAMPASSLAYWVAKFVRAGLLEVTTERRRAGKPIPLYRATAEEFQVPFAAMPPGRRDEFVHSSRAHMLTGFSAAMDAAIAREPVPGVSIRADPERGVELNLADTERLSRSIATEWWAKIDLTHEEAEALRDELEVIAQRYRTTSARKGTTTYFAMVGLVPEPGTRRR